MESSTTIRQMMAENNIFVPDYQRAYAWDTEQVSTFLIDLQDYINAQTDHISQKSPYYIGHFLFEKIKNSKEFGVIDGQQRLTSIVIILSVLFRLLEKKRGELTENEKKIFQETIKGTGVYKFKTVSYDNIFFERCLNSPTDTRCTHDCQTTSAKKIKRAFEYYTKELSEHDEKYLEKMIKIITNSQSTTHIVNGKYEAIQMFIFQNNRGKKPSNLEIIKAKFMSYIYRKAGREELWSNLVFRQFTQATFR